MAGKSRVRVSEAQGLALQLLAQSADRREADRARAILLTLNEGEKPGERWES